ncbi:MAG: plasmid pRiA4b ORF-3 family protein, partial [Solirubrobacterales bacterium]
SKLIRDTLKLDRSDVEFCRRELLENHPTAWLIEVNGFVVDARAMPPHIQAEARRRGLIPDLPIPESVQAHAG